jgi:hypothetical protein
MRDAPKPFASLSSGLLARKGGAKPAMRPQGYNGFGGSFGGSIEDLGWNDMGPFEEEALDHAPVPLGLTPSPKGHASAPHAEDEPEVHEDHHHDDAGEPPVVEQQRVLREAFRPEAEVVSLPRRRAAPVGAKAKAAFTLRLDPERHLKLRLASAVTHKSSQQLVTAALDHFLASLPELDALAARVPAEGGQRSRKA